MVNFADLHIGQNIYIVEHDPVTILELKVLNVGYDEDFTKRIKVANKDISFEVDFESIAHNCFLDKNYAFSVATKYVFTETNKFIRELTDGFFQDYFDLDKALEKYKISNPELFI